MLQASPSGGGEAVLALDTFRTMAQYNRWMNGRLYAVCAEIPDAERKRDRGAFFKFIHGTFNHLLLGDRLWLEIGRASCRERG